MVYSLSELPLGFSWRAASGWCHKVGEPKTLYIDRLFEGGNSKFDFEDDTEVSITYIPVGLL